jgi:hypothetical protein
VRRRSTTVADLIADLPSVFDHTKWAFSPESLLVDERDRVDAAVPGGTIDEILVLVPGKQLLPVAARQAGMNIGPYTRLVVDALGARDGELLPLGQKVAAALAAQLPDRSVPIKAIPASP